MVSAHDRFTSPAPAEREEIVRLLRARDWDGTARIRLRIGDHELTFSSTADGTATAVSYEEDSTRPLRWEKEFVEAWDATAG